MRVGGGQQRIHRPEVMRDKTARHPCLGADLVDLKRGDTPFGNTKQRRIYQGGAAVFRREADVTGTWFTNHEYMLALGFRRGKRAGNSAGSFVKPSVDWLIAGSYQAAACQIAHQGRGAKGPGWRLGRQTDHVGQGA